MDRETALKSYHEAVTGKISEFNNHLETSVIEHAETLEQLVKDAMNLLGDQMKKQEKEYVCFLYFSLLKTDFINRRYRFQLQGLDMRWYMDDEPLEIYVDAEKLFKPFNRLWEELTEESQGYGGVINSYDIQNILFEELSYLNSIICQILRYRLRDWEKKEIFASVIRSPYWVLKWGEYRDQSEILVQTDRVEKEVAVWKEQLAKAARKPETLVFSYWYKGIYKGKSPEALDMRFITFEEASLKNIMFQDCNMEGSRFIKCTLTDCTFQGCNLWGADFRGCSFEQTSFEGAELTAAIFPAESVPFLKISAEQLQVIRLEREGEE